MIDFPLSFKAFITPWLLLSVTLPIVLLLTKQTTKLEVVWRFKNFKRSDVET
jgi:hypothetical protein